ncbi:MULTISPECIES: transcription termination/antitermination protein NusG [unclassified Imperialibacter]|uniref:transcription termination/antitermination protein NusG n=1 Tax=unclassified Imperialibacter TaxID=2629706 RepID=UPI001257D447|nr:MULTISPECIES: UpxY family transcription antiterminator [unclassified Imperialibacter]CAD5252793.1 Antitermination protein NusG (modular protein) [Imperialibacter sp. 89]CAD5260944.1 Antitermination protein NusG (modular protein) [Imperialibacter sp. 75]VVT03836.1 Antitermination protein NusG (modular protein) [Imperialibacter sp. EC-SDR9]
MPATSHWYVLYTRSRAEKKVAESLKKHGFRSYCPTVTTLKQWSDRKKKVQEPLFRSYVFIQATEEERVLILQTPGVINFVYWLGKPAIVKQNEIEAIGIFTQEVSNHEVSELNFTFEDGAKVKVDWGAFSILLVSLAEDTERFMIGFFFTDIVPLGEKMDLIPPPDECAGLHPTHRSIAPSGLVGRMIKPRLPSPL